LSAGGRTIAVVATGLDNIGPATNRPIAKKITENNGTIISEYETGHSPRLYDFLHRNRIIAALSDIVIIPEAAEKSGSLNTAKHAKQLGIQVAAFPGNITSPMSGGTNHLLKNGAHTITNASDVLKILNIDASSNQVSLDLTGDTPEETVLLQKLALGFNDSTTLQHETLLNTVEFQTAATMLEVQGRIKQDETGLWSLS
jgi:DNA processing protein